MLFFAVNQINNNIILEHYSLEIKYFKIYYSKVSFKSFK